MHDWVEYSGLPKPREQTDRLPPPRTLSNTTVSLPSIKGSVGLILEKVSVMRIWVEFYSGVVLHVLLYGHILRYENRSVNRPGIRETGLKMSCYPPNDLLWVQITQSYPNRLRFSNLPCPQSPCHTVIDPVFKEGFSTR
jgi:hypothetical protein